MIFFIDFVQQPRIYQHCTVKSFSEMFVSAVRPHYNITWRSEREQAIVPLPPVELTRLSSCERTDLSHANTRYLGAFRKGHIALVLICTHWNFFFAGLTFSTWNHIMCSRPKVRWIGTKKRLLADNGFVARFKHRVSADVRSN